MTRKTKDDYFACMVETYPIDYCVIGSDEPRTNCDYCVKNDIKKATDCIHWKLIREVYETCNHCKGKGSILTGYKVVEDI